MVGKAALPALGVLSGGFPEEPRIQAQIDMGYFAAGSQGAVQVWGKLFDV